MSDEVTPQAAVVPPPSEPEPKPAPARSEVTIAPEVKEPEGTNGTITAEVSEPKKVAKIDAPADTSVPTPTNDQLSTSAPSPTKDKPTTNQDDIIVSDDIKPADTYSTVDGSAETTVDTLASGSKSKTPRRKSGGVPEHKKKLNKKVSKAKMTHIDAQPGDYFYVRLKGYPLWPAIVCDESMLPQLLIKSRPVTAARPDGTYRGEYEDGGAKAKDRTFPVMYLHTNEFGWIPNYDLVDLDFETVADISPNMRKDLAAAHQLASEQHDLQYFKDVLRNFMEVHKADLAAKEAKKQVKEANKDTKGKRNSKITVVTEGGEDTEMLDAAPEGDETTSASAEKPKGTKRKSESDPNPSETKKAKINLKLTNTPKGANGISTPRSAKDPSSAKAKSTKKKTPKVAETPEVAAPKEPELSAEEKRAKKEKEILFLRHKLQKGLLTRDQIPKEDEMKQMSEFVSKLEGYADLEVSIIRATKINKVLKAILKLPMIPKEEELQFKPRSQSLLDKWNKLLASEQSTPNATIPPATTNGNSATKTEGDDKKTSPIESINGVAQESVTEEKVEEKAAADPPSVAEDIKNAPAAVDSAPVPLVEDDSKESVAAPTPVAPAA